MIDTMRLVCNTAYISQQTMMIYFVVHITMHNMCYVIYLTNTIELSRGLNDL